MKCCKIIKQALTRSVYKNEKKNVILLKPSILSLNKTFIKRNMDETECAEDFDWLPINAYLCAVEILKCVKA